MCDYGRFLADGLNRREIEVPLRRTEDAEQKMRRAGADRVVNPHQIGGARMASFMLQPNVADFVGESMSDAEFEVRLSEARVEAGGLQANRSIEKSGVLEDCGVVILAIRRPDGSFHHQPQPDTVTEVGDVLITLGTPTQQEALRTWMALRD